MLNLRPARSVRPSAPLILSIIALIASLAGTGYAAGVLPANSVGTLHIRDKSVTSAKVRSWAITAPKIQPSAINSAKVADGSLLADDFAARQLPVLAHGRVPGGVSPAFTASATKNFTGVVHSATGTYCLTPAAGISELGHPAVVAVEPGGALLPVGLAAVSGPGTSVGCAAGDYRVETYRIYTEAAGGAQLADDVTFSIIVA